MRNYQEWVEQLDLLPHPEGGFYKETYRSTSKLSTNAEEFPEGRSHSTGIYFLLHDDNFSAFHRIKSDEMWHFYTGTAIEVVILHNNGVLEILDVGNNPENGEVFQAVVPANTWFASRVKQAASYALVGCTVAPGFDFQDFEMAERHQLITQFPQHEQIILQLTR